MEASQNGAPAKHPQVDNFSILEVFMVVDSVGDPPLKETPLSKTNENPMSDTIETSSQCQDMPYAGYDSFEVHQLSLRKAPANHPLLLTVTLLFNMAVEIASFPIQHGDFR